MASVLGMGVALIISMWGSVSDCIFSLNAKRWATPNLCCSSMMARAKFLKWTCSCITACVPTTNAASPLAMSASISVRSFFFWLPVSHATRLPNGVNSGSNQPMSLRKCCSAKISVGAMSAHCHPLSMAMAAANAATTVLPEPTSPCNKRCMGMGRWISLAISSPTRLCALVKAKGRTPKRCSCNPFL